MTRHLVQAYGARHLLLVGRTAPVVPEGLDADIRAVACDVADRTATAALLRTIDTAHPLTAVFHTAGVLDDATMTTLTEDRLHPVLAPKVDGAWNLHELCGDVGMFVLYSSVAGLLGAPGQGNYAAANAFLDALALHRRNLGLAAQSLAWGWWAETSGLTAALGDDGRARLTGAGVVPMSSEGVSLCSTPRSPAATRSWRLCGWTAPWRAASTGRCSVTSSAVGAAPTPPGPVPPGRRNGWRGPPAASVAVCCSTSSAAAPPHCWDVPRCTPRADSSSSVSTR
ncbi:SDR family NAD(P)-dependent oxidoreductase [Streptomyces malaysiensis subsp. malaysiensis]